MGLVTSVLAPLPIGALSASDDWWYQPVGSGATAAGVYVSEDSALKVGTFYRCVSIIVETIASLPLHEFERVGSDGRQRVDDGSLANLLANRPNSWQTTHEWVAESHAHKLMRGNAYSRIFRDRRGDLGELVPLHPDTVKVEPLDRASVRQGARPFRYSVRDGDSTEIIHADDMFHQRALMVRGYTGMGILENARQTVGLSVVLEQYGASFFGNGSRPGGVLEHPGKLNQQSTDRLKAGWESAHRGVGNAHRVAVLEEGMKFHTLSVTPEESQFLESQEHTAESICRWCGVPPHMVGLTSKSTSWGSGIEAMSTGFVIYTLLPWIKRFEAEVQRDLLLDPITHFASFILQGLLRGDHKTRFEAYAVARQWGWLSVNDIRRLEDLNPVKGGDAYLQALNMADTSKPQPSSGQAPAARLLAAHNLFVTEAAERVIRREIATLGKAAKRTAGDGEAWRDAVTTFYGEHAGHVAEVMHVGRAEAARYCASQLRSAIGGGAEALQDWESTHVASLVALAMAEDAA